MRPALRTATYFLAGPRRGRPLVNKLLAFLLVAIASIFHISRTTS